ncbi:MAG TPA: DNA-binding domain-containing protein [Candidatus Competibacteraceae bacterium]|nr:DNA-binding domain-containing protein [Candidatus Competibacteraceae bacterium]
MARLRELQMEFARTVLDSTHTDFDRYILASSLSGERRLQVYRNNVRLSLTEALKAVYPVTQRLVGDGFFRYAAGRYIPLHPSTSGNLHDFGGHFPDFLATFEPAAKLAYLPDVARLEWAYHGVFHAAESVLLDLAALAVIPPERHGELKFTLHPAARLLASSFPILRIWQVNQADFAGDPTVDLTEGGIRLLLLRRENLEIELQALPPGEFALLQALAEQQDFATACERALVVQADLDLPTLFSRHVRQGTLVDFSL